MEQGPFDLFVLVFGGLHRGGHYLWDTSQVDRQGEDLDRVRQLESALDDIYKAADRAIGQIISRAPPDARMLVFSLHGMEPNNGWSERLQSFAGDVANADGEPLRRRNTAGSKRQVFRLAPCNVRLIFCLRRLGHRVLEFVSTRKHNWQRTPWFVLPSDLAGFLRLNLQGREARGIVTPGEKANAIEDMLIDAFSRIEDLEGRPIIGKIESVNDLVATTDQFRRYLPDLLLNWNPIKTSETSGLRLNGREIARWPLGQPFDSGRSGNHATEGWFAAIGPGLSQQFDPVLHDIDGIVPSVYRWLGLEPPPRFVGKALTSLL